MHIAYIFRGKHTESIMNVLPGGSKECYIIYIQQVHRTNNRYTDQTTGTQTKQQVHITNNRYTEQTICTQTKQQVHIPNNRYTNQTTGIQTKQQIHRPNNRYTDRKTGTPTKQQVHRPNNKHTFGNQCRYQLILLHLWKYDQCNREHLHSVKHKHDQNPCTRS